MKTKILVFIRNINILTFYSIASSYILFFINPKEFIYLDQKFILILYRSNEKFRKLNVDPTKIT